MTAPPTTAKGRFMRMAARLATAGPWRELTERLTCSIGHRFPTNVVVLSFCRHFAAVLMEREGNQFERTAVLTSGGKMICSGEDTVGLLSAIYYFVGTITAQGGDDERPIAHLLWRAIKDGDTFFDIGANVGFYSFLAGPLCGMTGSVHAFEANPLLIPHLHRSAELNRPNANVVINAVAVGKEIDTTLELYDPERIGGSSLYKLSWLKSNSVTVPVTTIDEYVRRHHIDRIDVIKIDIEGAELDAFHGMQETFDTRPPWLIVCELARLVTPASQATAPDKATSSGSYPLQIMDYLQARGYEPRFISHSDGRLAGLVGRHAIEHMSETLLNVAFVRPELKGRRADLFCTP